jgi:predicted dinucleotide-binding enzyme
MEIAIIGAGNVGAALGSRLPRKGRRIRYGVPNPDEEYAALKSSANSTVTTPAEVVKPAGVVLFGHALGRNQAGD